jgi:neutral ceramidase
MNFPTAGSEPARVPAGAGIRRHAGAVSAVIRRCGWLAVLLPALLAADAPGEPGELWRVGLASVVITPPNPMPLAGYAAREGAFTRVEQDIHAKVLALEDARGGRALLITCDLVGLSQGLAEHICRRIAERSRLPRESILINFSHTHTGPAAALSLSPGGRYSAAEARAIVDYGQWLAERLVETSLVALAQRQEARLRHGAGQVMFPVNRRQRTAKGVVLGFDHQGPTDRRVPVLSIEAADGRLLGVVFGAACHNTCLGPKDNFICGDYAGYAQALLEKAMGGAQAMFVQGCGGDSSPYPTGSLAAARVHGAALAREVGRVLGEGSLRPIRGPIYPRLAWVDLPLEPAPTLEEIEAMAREQPRWRQQSAVQLRALHASGALKTNRYRAPLALWQFGSDLTFVGLPGEPVADYVRATEKTIGPENLWVAGYCNDHFGYLSNARILAEGGYEAQRGLGNGRRFAPEVEGVVMQELRALANAAGRPGGAVDR